MANSLTKQRITRTSNNEFYCTYTENSKKYERFSLLVIFYCINNHPQTQELQIINTYYLTVSVGQEFVPSLARCFWFKVPYEVTIKLSARVATSSEGSNEGGSTSELTHMVIGKTQLLTTSRAQVTGLKGSVQRA